jgi:circadian clock protein KaiC
MTSNRLSTGTPGLDDVLHGGLIEGRSYVVRGSAGAGKTILGMGYLTAGEGSSLLVSFDESERSLRENADAIGIDVSDVEILDLSPGAERFGGGRSYDVFEPDEVEGDDVASAVTDAIDRVEPDRVFLDPLTHLRYLSADEYRFRTEVAGLGAYLSEAGATTLYATQPTASTPDEDLEFLADGVIELRNGPNGRSVEVTKFRGSGTRNGTHTVRIREGGMVVYPKLVPGNHERPPVDESVSSGVDELDDLLGGGIDRGTVTVVSGPSGVGKTTTGTHFIQQAAAEGDRSVAYLFEEDTTTFDHRSKALGIDVDGMREAGTLAVEEVEPLSVSPDEFADAVRTEVEKRDARVVMIDGTAGYRVSIRGDDDDLVRELHALCRYLRNMGVTVVLVEEVPSVTGEFRPTGENISYLADNILFLRYIEVAGEIRKAMGMLKKRTGTFERTLREYRIEQDDGLVVGGPLTGLRGVLTGTPEFADAADES